MKYHKIKNIPLEVCTAEAKIAYNLAFSYARLFKNEYEKMPMQFQKCDVIHKAVRFCIKQYKSSYTYSNKYNIDVIFCALNWGLEEYIQKGCPILTSYESIGNIFESKYL